VIILDTNVVSELMKAAPDATVSQWFTAQDGSRIFTTAVSQAEIGHGIRRLPAGRRKRALEAASLRVFRTVFDGRVLPFDQAAAERYGALSAAREASGRPISVLDAQIAAICWSRPGARLATRDMKDFRGLDLDLVDPWGN
jgi:predicted nucleic acid-binding protein